MARDLEAAGFSTVLITMMPFWAEKVGTPRTLAVAHPFGQPLGPAGDTAWQAAVFDAALAVLAQATEPGAVVQRDAEWPVPAKEALKAWQPPEASPIIALLAPQIREMVRGRS